jgi:hypothetical protein
VIVLFACIAGYLTLTTILFALLIRILGPTAKDAPPSLMIFAWLISVILVIPVWIVVQKEENNGKLFGKKPIEPLWDIGSSQD